MSLILSLDRNLPLPSELRKLAPVGAIVEFLIFLLILTSSSPTTIELSDDPKLSLLPPPSASLSSTAVKFNDDLAGKLVLTPQHRGK